MRVTYIANPRAGRGRTDAFLTRHGGDIEERVLWTEAPGHGVELARQARAESDVVCAVGGDGTVHEVVNGLMPDPVPFVVMPAGSGNDFAGMFPFPRTPAELDAVLTAGMGARIDVLECGERYCVNSSGLGFEAAVTRESLSITRLRGLPLYLTAAMRALASFDCPPMTLELADGEKIEGERLMVSVGNGVSAGGGFHLTPDALPDDGLIDLCVVARIGRARVLRLLPGAIKGRHTGAAPVTMRRTQSVTISAERPFHVHVDGEYLGETRGPMHFRVIPRCLPVLFRSTAADAAPRLSHSVEKIL
jgi:YegS/Rv2252/BmrU family lipid kinase